MSIHRGSNERFNKKRTRSDNWTNREKELLLSIISDFEVVEDKSCVDVTIKKKAKAWQDISRILSYNSVFRQPSRIKEMWHRMKGTAKINISNYRRVCAHMGDDTGKNGGNLGGKPTDMDWTIAKIFPNDFTDADDTVSKSPSAEYKSSGPSAAASYARNLNLPKPKVAAIVNTDIYNLQWHNFSKAFSNGFNSLLENSEFVDVTVAIDGKYIQAHKLVLSVCSEYFRDLFKINPCQHPIVILKDVDINIFRALLQFMYTGEVQISIDKLPLFMKIAALLKVKGLNWDKNKSSHILKPLLSPAEPNQTNTPKLLFLKQNLINKRKLSAPQTSFKISRLDSKETITRPITSIPPPPLKQKPFKLHATPSNSCQPSARVGVTGALINLLIPPSSNFVKWPVTSKQETTEGNTVSGNSKNDNDNVDMSDVRIKDEHESDDDDVSVASNLQFECNPLDVVKDESNPSDEYSY